MPQADYLDMRDAKGTLLYEQRNGDGTVAGTKIIVLYLYCAVLRSAWLVDCWLAG